VKSTSARPVHIMTSTRTAPSTISPKLAQATRGAATRLSSSTGPAK